MPLHERLQHRLDELGFKPYMDAKRPDQVSRNSPNCTVGIIFSGDHDVLNRLAFGEQKLNTSDPNADHSNVTLQKGIYDWALDTYRFVCEKWGEENVVGFDVHCDETSIHAHVQTVPVEQVKKRGRIGSKYIHKDNPEKELSTKEWRALPKEERDNYTKSEATKGVIERVSYAKVWGERAKDKSQYLSQLHTDYYNKVGHKYGLARGFSYDELSEEEKEQAKKDMSDMLAYVGKLNELDTDGVEPMSHTFDVHNVFREDIVTNGDDRDNMILNAPESKDGCYQVPKTFD